MSNAIAGKPRVLAVEYDAERRCELARWLGQWELDFQFVAGGAAAIVTLRTAARHRDPFAIAIVCRDMPRMDGLMLIDAIHADARIRDTRLILRGEVVDDTLFAHSRHGDLQVAMDDFDGLHAALRLLAGDSLAAASSPSPGAATPCQGDGDGPVFDLAAFGERLDDDTAMMRVVAGVFVDDVSKLLLQARECAACGDWQRFGRIGHQIRGSAANVGCMALSAQAGRIEEACRIGAGERVVAALDELHRRFDALQAEMSRQLG